MNGPLHIIQIGKKLGCRKMQEKLEYFFSCLKMHHFRASLPKRVLTPPKGPFIYYVITFLGFLDPPPPYVSMFLVLRISKNWHFLTPPPPTADVIYEWPLIGWL